MELLKFKRTISVIVLTFALVGCSPEQSRFTLLFTSDYVYGDDISYIVSYDEKGNMVNNKEINGALYYNIINDNDKLLLNNGETLVSIDSDNHIEEKSFEKVLGYLEPECYFIYNDEPIFIYNTGFIDQENYETQVQKKDGKILTVSGRMHCFVAKDRNLYMLLSMHDSVSSDKYHLAKIDLDSLKIIETVELSEMTKKETVTLHGINLIVNSNEVVMFTEEHSDNVVNIKLYTISLYDYNVKEYDIDSFVSQEEIIYNSFFKLKNKIYFMTKSNKIFELQYDNTVAFMDTEIKLPKEIGAFPIIMESNGKIYVLEPGENKCIVEVDIKTKKVSDPINLEELNKTKNLYVYSFYVA